MYVVMLSNAQSTFGSISPGLDELETTSSVFEGSESGELGEAEDPSLRKFQRREDILHRDGGKGGQPDSRYVSTDSPSSRVDINSALLSFLFQGTGETGRKSRARSLGCGETAERRGVGQLQHLCHQVHFTVVPSREGGSEGQDHQ